MRPHALINTSDGDLRIPDVDAKGDTVLPEDIAKAVDEAMVVAGEGKTPEQRAQIRQGMISAHKQRMNGAPNGVGRY
jgi:hypothetical protein